MWDTMIQSVVYSLRTVHKGLGKGLEELEIRGRILSIHTSVFDIGKNNLKNLVFKRKLAVTQTPVKCHQLTLQ